MPGRHHRVHLRVGVGEGKDDRAGRHTGNVVLSNLTTGHPDEHVRTHQSSPDRTGQAARVRRRRQTVLVLDQVGARRGDDPARVTHHHITNPRADHDVCHRDTGGPGTRDDHPQRDQVLLHHASCVDQGSQRHDRRTVLVVMEHRDVQPLSQLTLDLETPRRRDVLQVDPAKGRRQTHDRLDQLSHRARLQTHRHRINPGKVLEQHRFSLHDRQRRQRADVAQAQHRGAIGDHRNGVPAPRVARSQRRVRRNRPRNISNARGIQQGQVRAVAERLGGDDLKLAALVRAEDGVVWIKAEGRGAEELCVRRVGSHRHDHLFDGRAHLGANTQEARVSATSTRRGGWPTEVNGATDRPRKGRVTKTWTRWVDNGSPIDGCRPPPNVWRVSKPTAPESRVAADVDVSR